MTSHAKLFVGLCFFSPNTFAARVPCMRHLYSQKTPHVGLHPLFLLKRALIPEMDNDFSKVTKFLVARADRGDISQLCADKYCSTLFTVTHDIDWMHKN